VIPHGIRFFGGTNGRDDFKGILARSGKGLDVKLLLSALQQSLEFEHYLEKRFSQTVSLCRKFLMTGTRVFGYRQFQGRRASFNFRKSYF